jgi:hypothetical protein
MSIETDLGSRIHSGRAQHSRSRVAKLERRPRVEFAQAVFDLRILVTPLRGY